MSTFGIPGNFRLLYLHVSCELARHKAVKVMLHGRFVTAIFSATQRCNDAAMLQSFESNVATMLQRWVALKIVVVSRLV